jgi:hypothetical protein
MSASTAPKTSVPIALSAEAVDDLIYDARAGDLEALNADIAALASQHNCNESQIVASAIDTADESEGGSGSCVLHFPAANGNAGMFFERVTCDVIHVLFLFRGTLYPRYFSFQDKFRQTD